MMAKRLPIQERVYTAGQLVARARVFFDVWFYYNGAETKPKIIDSLNEYVEFFRFDEHAHLLAFVVQIAGLFEKRENTINLGQLARELNDAGLLGKDAQEEVGALFERSTPLASKATVLRHTVFAHRSGALSSKKAFERANVTPNELRQLSDLSLQIANRLLAACDERPQFINARSAKHLASILEVLRPRV